MNRSAFVAFVWLLAGLAAAIPALADTPPAFVLEWGSYGQGTGQFNNAQGIDIDPVNGYIYVAERWNGRVQKFTLTGSYLGSLSFSGPWDVAVDGSGNLFVIDTNGNHAYKYSKNGALLANWGSYGAGNGQFSAPCGICVDASGYVYVADTYNYRIQKFTNSGAFVAVIGTRGTNPDQFQFPRGVTCDSQGNIYVVDSNAAQIKKFSSNGTFKTAWGSYGGLDGQMRGPYNAGVDDQGNVYVADSGNSRIQKFSSTGTFLTKWGGLGTSPGQFNSPKGVAAYNGNIYVADSENYRVERFGQGTQTGVGDTGMSVRRLAAFPNPFRSSTQIEFTLDPFSSATVEVFDITGRRVRRLAEETDSQGRTYSVNWNGTDESGRRMTPGIYFVRLRTQGDVETQKISLLP